MPPNNIRYCFTIDFVEPDPEEYPLDELTADEVDGDRDAIASSIMDDHADAIRRATERIRELIQGDEALDTLLSAHSIGLLMDLSHKPEQ